MKKTIFGSLVCLLILTGCGNQSELMQLSERHIESPTSFDATFPPDTGTYPEPNFTITIGTGRILSPLTGDVKNEISYTANEEDRQNGWKRSVVSGYLYTYIYSDLGLKITTSPLYEPYFYKKPTQPIFTRNHEVIYFPTSHEYIQMYIKSPSISLKTILQKDHLGTGCIAYNRMNNGYNPANDNRFQKHKRIGVDINNFFEITGPTGSLGSDIECHPDKKYPNSDLPIFFVQSKYHKDRYYKISMGDACAPGPCSIFGTIEFF